VSSSKQQQALFAKLKRLSSIYPTLEARLEAAAQDKHPYVLRALELFGHDQGRLIEQWRKAHALTEAEANLAMGIVEGVSLAEYAARNGVTVHTVRAQLKSIFQKTGVRRRPPKRKTPRPCDRGVCIFDPWSQP
jgi:DNA-binding CsgD family transcriptional regulator